MKNYLILIFSISILIEPPIKAQMDLKNDLTLSGTTQFYQNQAGPTLDSIVIFNNLTTVDSLLYSKVEFEYAVNKKSESLFFWDKENSVWLKSKKQTDTLNSQNQVVASVNYQAQNNSWIFYTRNVHTYSQNNLVSRAFYDWNNLENKWNESWKYEYDYSSKGNLLQKRFYDSYSIADSLWIIASKRDYIYNTEDQLTNEYDSVKNGSTDFEPDLKSEYTFDSKGRKSLNLTYHWNENFWQYEKKQEYEYNSNNILTLTKSYKYNLTNQSWDNERRHEIDYDNAGNLVLDYESTWDTSLSAWHGYKIYEWQYNGNNDLMIYLERTYDLDFKLWSGFKHEYTYGPYRNTIYTLDYTWNNQIYDFEFISKSFYYFTGHFSAIQPVFNNMNLAVYPNPCAGFLYIENNEHTNMNSKRYLNAQITDLSGREITKFTHFPINQRFEINSSALNSGFYLLNIQSGDEYRSIKFLKK